MAHSLVVPTKAMYSSNARIYDPGENHLPFKREALSLAQPSLPVTGKSIKFFDFQIFVQLILVLVCLQISCTTIKTLTNLRLLPVTGHYRH